MSETVDFKGTMLETIAVHVVNSWIDFKKSVGRWARGSIGSRVYYENKALTRNLAIRSRQTLPNDDLAGHLSHLARNSCSQATVQPRAIWCTPAWFTRAQLPWSMVYVAAVQTGWQMLEGFDLCVHQDLLMREESCQSNQRTKERAGQCGAKFPALLLTDTDTEEREAPERQQRDPPPTPDSCHTRRHLKASIESRWDGQRKCLNQD